MELDWSALQTEAARGGLLPDGDEYHLIVVDAVATKASTGKPMIKAKFRVLDGPHEGRPAWAQFTLSPENPIALRIWFQHMAAFGLESSFFSQLPSGDEGLRVIADNMRNRGVTAKIGTRPYQGVDRNDITPVGPLPFGVPLPPGVVTGPPSVSPQGMAPSGGPPVPSVPSAPPTATPSAPTPQFPSVPTAPVAPTTPPPAQPF